MSASSTLLGVAVLLLQLWATLSFPSSGCPVPCLCRNNLVLNCSSLGLTRIPKPFPEGAVSLNISNNSLGPLVFAQVQLKWLRYLWVDRNGLESLSLMEKSTSTLLSGEHECTSWTPDLRMLSAEQNHLKYLPKGLGCMKLLQILQLSHNQISEISLSDLHKCHHLKELHLEHNSITTIHPRAFQDLKQLKVLNLRYNLLATIPNTAYQSLQNLNALVEVSFNRWHCDCKLNILRKWIRHDTERGDTSWQVLCSSPPRHAGKSLIHLEELEHMCRRSQHSTTGHYHNMIVNEGMKITIPCSNYSKDIMNVHWWTPNGQTTENLHELLIEDTTEKHSGLYICTSEKIWRRIRHKGESKSTSTSSSEPQPYLNEGYSDYSEDQDQEVRVGSRVTFGGITEVESQVPCYATVENEQSDDFSERSIEAEGVYEVVEENQSSFSKGNQSALEVESHRGSADPTSKSSQEVIHPLKPELGSVENMEFEPIPNENQVSETVQRDQVFQISLAQL
ncbi:hypothetical protein DNTS_035696 [Danionella cerebrum]|uniref:Ig-like domain-containing protein n=1 Tax=Danionella cerebrum TaxID=2873325 RepID=A0A553REX2_9TELE|nr:hypothetical protein DNTS_035696 [Danionella translucida]